MLYREIIAVWSENRKKHTNSNVSVHFGNESPTFRYHHVTNAGNWLPRDAEPLPRTKTSATPLRRAETSREKTQRGQRVYWCTVWVSHWWWSCHWALKGCCQLWQDRMQQECRLGPNRVVNLHEELSGSAQRWCCMWRRVVRRVVSNVSNDSIAFTVKNSKKNACTEPTTERPIPRDLSFGELRSFISRLFMCRNCLVASVDGRTSLDAQTCRCLRSRRNERHQNELI